jgi:predicted ATPase/DNA-binding SARP family transcriptional activator
MDFRILGPLEVVSESGPIAVGGAKPRALLAALLVYRGSVVPTGRLLEALWGEDPPRHALESLRAYASRLRSVLEQAGGGPALRFRATGYVLDVPAGRVDAAEFERLFELARSHIAGGDDVGAVPVLEAALALWRGEALSEFADCDLVRAETARLAQLRVLAVEERVDALLRLGRHAEVIPQLEDLVRLFPGRERPVMQLMRALYGCGRQADALGAYQELRTRLVEELGVEPSPPTRLLHRQVLAQDPALTTPTSPSAGNLPRSPTCFLGRDREVAEVSAALRAAPVVTLTGVGGVGKSRLALEVATRERGRFRDGVWMTELAPLRHADAVGHAVAVALRVRQRAGLSIEQTLVEYLRGRCLMLVLDNCEHVLEATRRLLDDVVWYCPRVVVLATSRAPVGADGEQLWPVPPLSVRDATSLFVRRAQAAWPRFRTDRETVDAVEEICRRLDGLPLAIELAAARMRAMSATELLQRLDGGHVLVGGRGANGQRHHQSLAATIDWSYRLLSPREQRLFDRLSIFAGGADLDAVHALCAEPDVTEDDTLQLLAGLVDKSMVQPVRAALGTRYQVLETLRSFGRDRLGERGEQAELARRHAGYFVELAERVGRGVLGPDEPAWAQRSRVEHDNFRAAWQWAIANSDVDLALRLITSLPMLSGALAVHEITQWADRILDLTPEAHPLYVAALGVAARGAWGRGEHGRVRELAARARGRVPAPGSCYFLYPNPADVVADVCLYTGDGDGALRHYEAELDRARRGDDPPRLVWTLYRVAQCHAMRGTPALGLPVGRECLRLADELGNPTFRFGALYALGQLVKGSDPDRALALFDQATALGASAHNDWSYGIALMEAVATRAVHGDAHIAARSTLEVLDLWDRLGGWNQQWRNLAHVVHLFARLGAEEDAVTLHHCLVAAAKPSSLDSSRLARLLDGPHGERFASAAARGAALTRAEAVTLARTRLRELA